MYLFKAKFLINLANLKVCWLGHAIKQERRIMTIICLNPKPTDEEVLRDLNKYNSHNELNLTYCYSGRKEGFTLKI